MANIGRLALKILGVIAGLLGVLVGLVWIGFGIIASTSVHMGYSGGLMIPGGIATVLIGLLGIKSIFLYAKKPKVASKLLLSLGIMGFFIGYATDYKATEGFLGLIAWTAPGTLMIVAGLICWITPEKIASSLPLLKNDRRGIRLAAQAIYGGLFAGGIVLMMGILFIAGALFIGFQEENKSDCELFSEALMHESYGAYDSALSVYDRIIARNETNAMAWRERGDALEALGRYDEAEQSYERALQLESANGNVSSNDIL